MPLDEIRLCRMKSALRAGGGVPPGGTWDRGGSHSLWGEIANLLYYWHENIQSVFGNHQAGAQFPLCGPLHGRGRSAPAPGAVPVGTERLPVGFRKLIVYFRANNTAGLQFHPIINGTRPYPMCRRAALLHLPVWADFIRQSRISYKGMALVFHPRSGFHSKKPPGWAAFYYVVICPSSLS